MNNQHTTSYLLGELTEEETERFEERCFAEEEWPAELDSVEQELIDAYLCNELNKDQRLRFETHYLTTDARKTRVLTAQSLLHVLTQAPTKSVRQTIRAFWEKPLVPQLALVMIVVLAFTIWLVLPSVASLLELDESHRTIYVGLTSWDRLGGVRETTVTVPLDRDALFVYLNPPKETPGTVAYRIQWEDANGVVDNVKAPNKWQLRVRIPAAKLKPGQYVLKLYEIYEDGTEQRVSGGYYFSAVEKRR